MTIYIFFTSLGINHKIFLLDLNLKKTYLAETSTFLVLGNSSYVGLKIANHILLVLRSRNILSDISKVRGLKVN